MLIFHLYERACLPKKKLYSHIKFLMKIKHAIYIGLSIKWGQTKYVYVFKVYISPYLIN